MNDPLTSFWTNDPVAARASLLDLVEGRVGAGGIERIGRALDLVEECHRGQERKGTEAPYAVHPIRVACNLVDAFGVTDADLVCTALLHDVLEDTPTRKGSIERAFGPRCANLVSTLSRAPGEQRPVTGDRADSTYLRRIQSSGDEAVLLKMADKIDNLLDAPSHPDRERVKVFVDETFSAYVPLARSLTDARQARRAERLLLEAAARAGGIANPKFLEALLSCLSRALALPVTNPGASEIPFPQVAVDLYLFLNPNAEIWLEYDGHSFFVAELEPRELVRRIAGGLRRKMTGGDLPALLELAGMPPAFASPSNAQLWHRAAALLTCVQELVESESPLPWLAVLLRKENRALLLALVQSSLYLPASWRSPLWSVDLGGVLAQRIEQIDKRPASRLLPFVLSHRLAFSRYADGTGTLARAREVFAKNISGSFSSEALWALRIGAEYLQGGSDDLWTAVHSQPFKAVFLPARRSAISALTNEPERRAAVETIGLREARALFAEAGMEEQLVHLVRALLRQPAERGITTWIELDHEEWRKRRPRWSQAGELCMRPDVAAGELETLGVRVVRGRFGNVDLVTVLPARRFALRNRLPEMSAANMKSVEEAGFTAISIFDTMIGRSRPHSHFWTPRLYRILDTLGDLDPEGVQTVSVDYESGDVIPPLHAYLPLPHGDAGGSRQEWRKRFLARYIVAQVYSCGLVRRVRRARISCSAVPEHRRRFAFTEGELHEAVAEAERDSGLRAAFGTYVERYAFDPFGIMAAQPPFTELHFEADEMRRGSYVGIDIGGQRVKIAVVKKGDLLGNPQRPEMATPGGIEVSAFCRELLSSASRELRDVGVPWSEISGVGISWPGAVRDNRIVGMSRVLQDLTEDGRAFSPGDPIDRLGGFDFVSRFVDALRTMAARARIFLRDDLAVALLNDGDAEALGNHALRTLKGMAKPGGKIFVKLGTSLAGGRITADGAVAEEIAEYSKILLNLKSPGVHGPPAWLARYYVSAEGVRNLSRSFRFGNAPLFGERNGANADQCRTRIEPIELGMLLPLFLDGAERRSFLAALIARDNQPSATEIDEAIAATAAALRTTKQAALLGYIRDRGADLGRVRPGWATGLRRTLWLCTGKESRAAFREEVLPRHFPYEAMARAVVGSVALFSQLGLHVAHLIAQLYNIYRRGTFSEVVLAGGVLGGRSGETVETQTKGFLAKYYDKVYGPGKPLGPDTLVHAGFEGVSNPGVFGAAMAANRRRQVERDRLLSRKLDERLGHLSIGEEVSMEEILVLAGDPAARDRATQLLERHFAKGEIARTPGGGIQKIS